MVRSPCKRAWRLTCGLVRRVNHVAYSTVGRKVRVTIGVAFVCHRTYAGPVYKDAFNGAAHEDKDEFNGAALKRALFLERSAIERIYVDWRGICPNTNGRYSNGDVAVCIAMVKCAVV
jgi:hypothetical protein